MNIKTKQIAFNLDDPAQERLYKHVSKFKNFSFYGKCLIQRDLEGVKQVDNGYHNEQPEVSLDKNIIEGFI